MVAKNISILFLLTSGYTFAQSDTISARKAKSKINKEVIVKALVAGTKIVVKDDKRTLIISLDKPYPKTPLQVILFNKAYTDLNLLYLLDGKYIIVKGTVTTHNDRPQIIVSDIQNLTILPDANKN